MARRITTGSSARWRPAASKPSTFRCSPWADEVDYARVSYESLRRASVQAMSHDAEALFISCTALRATGLIAGLEIELGRPVVTSTQAMWWEALQFAGAPARHEGAGRLFTL